MTAPAVISAADLPASYEAAKVALSECAEIDECKGWADRAAALASYAKQADDDHLELMARRIRSRAIRRAGELLKMVEPSKGGRPPETNAGDHNSFSRKQAASDAGMSHHQTAQAIRIANVPQEDFDGQVESNDPPTLSQLASQGIKPRPRPAVDLGGRDASTYNRIIHFIGDLENAAKELEALKPSEVAKFLNPDEASRAAKFVSRIDMVCDRIATEITHAK